MNKRLTLIVMASLALLAGCEQLGIDDPAKIAAAKEADGKAIGGACRHAARAIEDCYTLNPKASRAAVFTGWREMDEYMRENKLEAIAPVVPRPGTAKPAAEGEEGAADKASGEKSGKGEKADKAEKSDKSAKAAKPAVEKKAEKAAEKTEGQ